MIEGIVDRSVLFYGVHSGEESTNITSRSSCLMYASVKGAHIYVRLLVKEQSLKTGVTIGSPDDRAITVIGCDQYVTNDHMLQEVEQLMKHKVIGVINFIHETDELESLTAGRCLGNCAFRRPLPLDRFHVIEHGQFRNLEGRGICPYQISFLMDHLGSGKHWDLQHRQSGLFMLPPATDDIKRSAAGICIHFYQHRDYFNRVIDGVCRYYSQPYGVQY